MATRVSDQQAAQAETLTQAFKASENQRAAKYAALVALYYQQRVNVQNPASVEAWLNLMIPRLIGASDEGARRASTFYQAVRRIEVPQGPSFTPEATLGMVDDGVRKSLMAVGPGDYMNKLSTIERLNVSPQQKQAMLAEAKQVTTTKIASATVRHVQAGSRQTVLDNTQKDDVALGWVRVTKAKPCFFCAMLASRGLEYRAFKKDSFTESDARFTGDGDAKVHDNCGCSLKPVYVKTDPMVAKTADFADMWSRWGAGGNGDTRAILRFRRGYDHWAKTGEFLSWDAVDASPHATS